MSEDSNFQKEKLYEFLISESKVPFSGWDFSYIKDRMVSAPLTWSYSSKVHSIIRHIDSVLDMGTGGGELFSSFQPFPKHTCATEGFDLNFPVAKKKLEPLGVKVIKHDNDDNLPFENEEFELIINRHESYSVKEVYRILKSGGHFITQQVGGDNDKNLRELLTGEGKGEYDLWNVNFAANELGLSGFEIVEKKEFFPLTRFFDTGAIVFYLTKIPWEIPDFSVDKYFSKLWDIDNTIQELGYLDVLNHRFFIEAFKP
jgi:SAM-dependent methyltransferase